MPETIEKVPIKLKVNGRDYELSVEPRMLLVDMIRNELSLTGTHIGCETTYCGACTVLLNGRTVKSCTVFAVQADQGEILTVEGLEQEGQLHPLQEAFAGCHVAKNPRPDDKQIRKGIAGNTCRCTGYQNIIESIKAAAGEMARR
jgi:carbon-monoxide dehydrogenase small subunit